MNIVININMLTLVYHPKYILPRTDDLIKWFTFINNGTLTNTVLQNSQHLSRAVRRLSRGLRKNKEV